MERIDCPHLAERIGEFLTASVMPRLKDPVNIGMLAVAKTALGKRAIESKVYPVFELVSDDDGTVCVGELREAVMAYVRNAGSITILFDRIKLKSDDVDAFFSGLV